MSIYNFKDIKIIDRPDKKILVIDDNPGTIAVLKDILNDEGYIVTTAWDGEEGLAIYESENPSLIITDLNLPKMNGIEVLKKIRRENLFIPIIIITGYA